MINIRMQKLKKQHIEEQIKEYIRIIDLSKEHVIEQKLVRQIIVDSFLFGHISIDEVVEDTNEISKAITRDEIGINQLAYIVKQMKSKVATINLAIELPFDSNNMKTWKVADIIKYDLKTEEIAQRLLHNKEVFEENNDRITCNYLMMINPNNYERLKKEHDLKFMDVKSGKLIRKKVRLIPTYYHLTKSQYSDNIPIHQGKEGFYGKTKQ